MLHWLDLVTNNDEIQMKIKVILHSWCVGDADATIDCKYIYLLNNRLRIQCKSRPKCEKNAISL